MDGQILCFKFENKWEIFKNLNIHTPMDPEEMYVNVTFGKMNIEKKINHGQYPFLVSSAETHSGWFYL